VPSILQQWYSLKVDTITERVPLLIGATAVAVAPFSSGHLPLTITCFMLALAGIKSYQPVFWSLPSLFLIDTAAAGSIGLIN
jgi:hypothetical protein